MEQSGSGPMMLLLLLLLAVCVGFVSGRQTEVKLRVSSTFHQGDVDLTDDETFVLTWRRELPAQFIALFNTNPPNVLTEFTEVQPLIRVSPRKHPQGYLRTNITFTLQAFPNGWNRRSQETTIPGDTCLDYWIAAYMDSELMQADCLRIRPTWMNDHRDALQNVSVAALFFGPGHDIIRYGERYWPVAVERGGYIELNKKVTVWNQLVRGVRFFSLDYEKRLNDSEVSSATKVDSREEYDEEQNNCQTLFGQFREIQDFLNKAKNEIIIIEVKYCAGPDRKESDLLELADDLQLALGDYILPPEKLSYNSTLTDIWQTRRNVIVTLNGTPIPKDIPWMWSPVPRIREGKNESEGIHQFLRNCMVTDTSTRMTAYLLKNLSYHAVVETLGNPERKVVKLYPVHPDPFDENATSPAYVGNTFTDLPIVACLDNSNNIIFLPVREDDLC